MPTSTAVENRKKIAKITHRKGRKPKEMDAPEYPPTMLGRVDEEDLVLYEYGTVDPRDGEFRARGFGEYGKMQAKTTIERYPAYILAKRLVHPVEGWDGD